MADFETVSTSSLQIKVKVPRSPSPSCQRTSVLRSSSMRQSRLDHSSPNVSSRPPTTHVLSVRSAYSRSLSPRPQRPGNHDERPAPPPSPSGMLPTRAPTPPMRQLKARFESSSAASSPKTLRVPGNVGSRGQITPRSLSPRCAISN